MKTIREVRGVIVLAALLPAVVGAGGASTPQSFAYQDTIMQPSGTQQNVIAIVTVAPQSSGAMRITLTVAGQSPVTVMIPAGGNPPAPQGSPSPQRAQAALILERVGMLGQIKKAVRAHVPIAVQIPVLPPGALQPLQLPATLTPSSMGGATAFVGNASIATSATVDPSKAKIKGIMPVRRVAERLKNAATPSHVTLPDQVNATVSASVGNGTITLSGHVTHALTAKGQTTTLHEDWSLKPSA